jgi:M6 family metalloprotease-like protein
VKWLAPVIAALALVGPAQAATCTAAEKQTAQAALAAYQKKIPKERVAYFKKHKRAAQRKAFVKKQQAKLKRLRRAAACDVPPPSPPPPPPDTTAPKLVSARVDASTVTVAFDEDVNAAAASFAVHVNGAARAVQSMAASGKAVVLTLAQPVGGDDLVALDYGGGVKDSAGNVAAPAPNLTVANATPAACSFMVGNNGLSGGGHANEGATDTTLYAPSTGTLRGIILWLDFSDAPATESIPALTEQLVPPAQAEYAAMSYGKFSLHIDAAPRWYRLAQPSTYYGLNASDGPGRKDQYIADSIQSADLDIDFSQYDVVYLVASAGASADMTTETDRQAGQPLAVADGKEIRHAVFIGNARLQEPRHGSDGIVHETGHVIGLPDLYGDPTSVGGWDPMSFNIMPGAEFMAWQRWKLGWLDPSQIRCVQPGRTVEATLTPLEPAGGVKMVVAPLDATRAVVIENRQPLGYDTRLCDKGVLVYTVEGTVTFPGSPIHVLPAHPGTDTDGSKQQQCGPKYDAPLDLAAGETSSMTVPQTGITIQLMSAAGSSYVVRVSRSP